MKQKVKLFAPSSYWEASPEVLKQVTNGCGTSGWKGALVPDTIYFLSIKAACNIHDWMYAIGKTLADKKEADRVFLNNMLRIIDHANSFAFLEGLRRARAYEYYEAVKVFGGPAFWDKKNLPDNLGEARAIAV
jgi:hypothetical protein